MYLDRRMDVCRSQGRPHMRLPILSRYKNMEISMRPAGRRRVQRGGTDRNQELVDQCLGDFLGTVKTE